MGCVWNYGIPEKMAFNRMIKQWIKSWHFLLRRSHRCTRKKKPQTWDITWVPFRTLTLWLCQNSYWKWPSRNSGFSHEKLWFSIAMLNYQRVKGCFFCIKLIQAIDSSNMKLSLLRIDSADRQPFLSESIGDHHPVSYDEHIMKNLLFNHQALLLFRWAFPRPEPGGFDPLSPWRPPPEIKPPNREIMTFSHLWTCPQNHLIPSCWNQSYTVRRPKGSPKLTNIWIYAVSYHVASGM